MNPRLLIVDDEQAMCDMLRSGLSVSGYDVTTTTDAARALDLLADSTFDCLITDVRMGRASGIELCRRVCTQWPQLPVIVVTAFGSINLAIEAIRAGAFEFVTKPFELDAIRHVVGRALERRSLANRVKVLEQSLRALQGPDAIAGTSEAIRQLKDLIRRAGPSDVTVLVQGESGAGKELVAREIHAASNRSERPFLAINCAALPEALLESELFGHARGAFTDAKADKAGLLTQCADGTIFLDEIGELPLSLQPKLLRVLQERVFRPIGGKAELPLRARVVAATNRDLEAEARAGRFREDLFYRIAVVQLDVPPLRARGNDVLQLADRFAQSVCERLGRPVPTLSREFRDSLLAYSWPGNVRELANCMERAIALSDGPELGPSDLPERLRASDQAAPVQVEFVPLEEIERRHILQVFQGVGGNKSLAARILGLNRKTLYRKLREYGVALGDGDG